MSLYFAESVARALNTTSTLSLESVDVDINIGQDAILDEDGAITSPLAPGTDEPIIEAQETELAEETNAIGDTEEELDNAEADVETLESIQIQLGKAIENGGLDTVSYEMLNITMDHIYRKYGIATANVMPSMEAFGDDKVGQTQVSMEKVGTTISSIAAGAAEFLRKLWFQIKQMIMNIIKLNFTMDKRLDAMIKAARAVPGDATAKTIKLYSAKRLLVGGKLPSKQNLISNYAKIVKASQTYAVASDDYFEVFTKQQAAILNATDTDESKSDLAQQAATVANRFDQLKSILLFQDAELVVTSRGVGEGKSLFPGIKLKTTPAPDNVNSEIEPLSPAEVVTLAGNIKVANANLKALSKTTNNKTTETLILKLAGKTDGKLTKEVKAALKDAVTVHGRMIGYFNGVSKAMADYCAQSLSAHSKPKAAAKADDAAKEPAKDEAAAV